jgi:hypothetical protein
MSDFSDCGYCRKHKMVVCPNDGGCPRCADEEEARCFTCGGKFDEDGYCSCYDEEGKEEECLQQ